MKKCAAIAAAVMVVGLVPTVAQADSTGPDSTGADPTTRAESASVDDGRASDREVGITVVDTLYTVGGEKVSTSTYTDKVPLRSSAGSDGPAAAATAAAAVHGTSTASGCRKVDIYTGRDTLALGKAYRYYIWTRWCWDRSREYILPGGSNGWYLKSVHPLYDWKGEVRTERYFYDAGTNNGRPRSAFKHYRQGKFQYCPIKFGCVASHYPELTLRSYYNGTYAYSGKG